MDFNEDLGKSDLQKSIDKENEEMAREVERGTFKKTKSARKKLEEAALRQKSTTNKMKMINENLDDAKKSGIKTYKNAKKSNRQAIKLSNERNILNPFSKIKTDFEIWREDDKAADENIEQIERRKISNDKHLNNQENVPSIFGNVGTQEEKETNQELLKILTVVNDIEKETEIQKNEGKKQKTNLEDIQAASEYARKEAELATNKLEHFNESTE